MEIVHISKHQFYLWASCCERVITAEGGRGGVCERREKTCPESAVALQSLCRSTLTATSASQKSVSTETLMSWAQFVVKRLAQRFKTRERGDRAMR